MDKNIIAMAGAGQVGTASGLGSLAGGGASLVGYYDINQKHLDDLADVEREWGLHGKIRTTSDKEFFLDSYVPTADGVGLAVHLGCYDELVRAIAPQMKTGAWLMDFGSHRGSAIASVQAALRSVGRDDIFFFWAHPSVGTGDSGPRAAQQKMYAGKAVFISALRDGASEAEKKAYAQFLRFWEKQQASLIPIDPATHDLFFGITSHGHHGVGAMPVFLDAGQHFGQGEGMPSFDQAGTSLCNTGRVIRGLSYEMWRPIWEGNRANVERAAAGILSFLDEITEATAQKQRKQLERTLRKASDYRDTLRYVDAHSRVSREGVFGDMADYMRRDMSGRPQPEEVVKLIDATPGLSRAGFVQAVMKPYVMGVAETLTAHKNLSGKIDLAAVANPSFMDGSAPALNDPAYMARLLLCHRESAVAGTRALQTYVRFMSNIIMKGEQTAIEGTVNAARTTALQLPLPRRLDQPTPNNRGVRPTYIIPGHLDGTPRVYSYP